MKPYNYPRPFGFQWLLICIIGVSWGILVVPRCDLLTPESPQYFFLQVIWIVGASLGFKYFYIFFFQKKMSA